MTKLLIPAEIPIVHAAPRQASSTRKVLHVVNGEHYAGAARVQDLLGLTLPKFDYDISYACVLPDRFEAERQAEDCAVYNFPMKHRLDLGPASQVADLVRTEGFDIIHSHTTRSAMIATVAAGMAKVPFIHHVHCQMNTEVGQRLKTFVNTSIERFSCHRADHVLAVSGSIKRFLARNGFTRTDITVVPNGVPAPEKLSAVRKRNTPWTIGMIALLRQRKGLETLIQTLPDLTAEHDVQLRIVGSFETPEYENEIRQLVDELGVADQIDWTGFVRNVHAEIAKMDVLVLPSVLPEGMPMVLLEAMSAGVPIVGSRVDGITDVIRHEGNGLLAEPGDVQSLASELRRILCGERDWNLLRSNCLDDYNAHYSETAMAESVAKVYDCVLASRRNSMTSTRARLPEKELHQ